MINLSTANIEKKEASWLMRPTDIYSQIPDSTKFVEKTGWRMEVDFDESLKRLMEHYRGDYE